MLQFKTVFFLDTLGKISKKILKSAFLSRFFFKEKDKLVYKYISKYNVDSQGIKKNNEEYKVELDNNIVWTGWLQGYGAAPELVKSCLNNIKNKSNGHKVIFISDDNIQVYLPDFSKKILDKYHNGEIIPAHFMDIVRVKLIYKYGGLWIDPTVILTKQLTQDEFVNSFFSYKTLPGVWHSNPADSLWCTFYMGGTSGSYFYKLIDGTLSNYWIDNNRYIDYFLLDYVMKLNYLRNKKISETVDKVAISTNSSFELSDLLKKEYSKKNVQKMKKILKGNAIYKLSYKESYNNELFKELLSLI